MIVNYSSEVQDNIFNLHDGSFPYPNFDDPTFISKKVIIHNGQIIGCSLLKLTTELILIMDQSSPKKSRVIELDKLQKKLVCELLNRGIRDTHIFVNNPVVSKFARHMGFQDCPEKECLSLRFGY